MATKWFTYRQNNSGGSFDHEPENGIGIVVFIEARDSGHANARAQRIGLYFDGCDNGQDCSCCGDRWYPQSDGSDEPERYGDKWRAAKDDETPTLDWGLPSYMHPLTGDKSFLTAVQVSA